ncbi:ATP synthase F1 subunit gamma [Ureaplasma canigenitalium]|uniref:ATP synthase F1 subunit gamma n=1 Tax=Ureaplasma canigenitalium TaxID=42092 RepID=UPI0004E20D4D|nr:ATP synthase F1 subunit gamma [Ureaplasma canigenitalium]
MSLDTIKRKITSIKTTAKTTNAMKLVATAKLKRQRDHLAQIKEYSADFYEVIGLLLSTVKDIGFLNVENAKDRTLYITINSTMGLAGSYNYNVNKVVKEILTDNDITFTIGKKGNDFMRFEGRSNQVAKFFNLNDNDLNFDMTHAFAKEVLDLYLSGEVNRVVIVYTKFINAITFEVETLQVLPFDTSTIEHMKSHLSVKNDIIIFHPNKEAIVRKILPNYISTILLGCLMNSKISENASRRNAMDAATNNAKALAENYKLVYNTLRQGKITSEITEIVGGSNDDD